MPKGNGGKGGEERWPWDNLLLREEEGSENGENYQKGKKGKREEVKEKIPTTSMGKGNLER